MLKDFFPTPASLIEKMIGKVKMSEIKDILEPSAGKGDITDLIRSRYNSEYRVHSNKQIDVIEIDSDLQHILKGKGYRLIHDDFLTFQTAKRYDLVIANFPFSEGDKHLEHALNILERQGGRLVCLVNAETIRNNNSARRETLKHQLWRLSANIEYLAQEFENAERRTNVEVALIHVAVEAPQPVSVVLDSLKKADEINVLDSNPDEAIVAHDFMTAIIARFEFEQTVGVKLLNEYFSLKPFIMNRIPRPGETSSYSAPLIELKVRDKEGDNSLAGLVNSYVRGLRHKYWELLVSDPRFNSAYTTDLLRELQNKLESLKDYDFTRFNILELEKDLRGKISRGIEAAIVKLFDQFSRKFMWDESIHNGNVHYYNGWKSNKAHKINLKIIQPVNGFSASRYDNKDRLEYSIKETLSDMVKVFNYLSDERSNVNLIVGRAIDAADTSQNFRAMDLRYFETTFYKKGTCHIKFKDQELLDKFNIFGSQRKGWLPPAYGKVHYQDLEPEAQTVIDEFQGKDAYEKIVRNADFYIVETERLMIDTNIAEETA